MVIWITGLSASGKTTLALAIRDLLKPRLPQLLVLDGDIVRKVLGSDLNYSEQDRTTQIGRLQGLARNLSEQGAVVVVAALYSHPDLLSWNRLNLLDYFEVYLEGTVTFLRTRDSKHLYAEALAGQICDVVGVDIPPHIPLNPDLTFDAEHAPAPEEMARQVVARIAALAELVAAD